MRTTKRLVGFVVSVATFGLLSGCWAMPGHDPDRTGYNPDEHVISPANVATMTKAWSYGGGGTNPMFSPVVSSAGVHAIAPCGIATLDPATGGTRWARALTDVEYLCTGPAGTTSLSGPFVVGNTVLVGVSTSYQQRPGPAPVLWQGGTSAFDVRTGAGATTWVDGVIRALRGDHAAVDLAHTIQFPGIQPVLSGHVQASGSDPALNVSGSVGSSTLGTDTLFRVAATDVQAYVYDEVTDTCGSSGVNTCPTWTFTADSAIVGRVVLSGGGETAYVSTLGGTVYALDGATGAVRWSTSIGSSSGGGPALAEGMLYVPTRTGGLVAVDAATGAVQWSGSTGSTSPIITQPAVGGGVVFVAASDGTVAALDAAGCGSTSCDPLWTTDAGAPVSGSPVVDGGQLYVPLQGYLVAYRPAAA